MRSGGNTFSYFSENILTKLANLVQFRRMFMFCLENWGPGSPGFPLPMPMTRRSGLVMCWCFDLASGLGGGGANDQLHPRTSDRLHEAVYDSRDQHFVPQTRE